MSMEWPGVQLGEVLRRSEEKTVPVPGQEYREVTVRLWGKGVIERGRTDGGTLSGKRFIAREGQFIISRIDARNGAMGIVPPALDGALVTNDFPLFSIDSHRVEPALLEWLSRTRRFVDLCQHASEGTTNRVRLQEDKFLTLEIRLPSLSEQRRIVARIEELAAHINEVHALYKRVAEQTDALLRAILFSDKNAKQTPMGDLVHLRYPDVTVRANESYQFAGVYSFGRGVFIAQRRMGLEFAYPRLTTLRKGDFVYPKLMAWEGALGIAPDECDGCVVSTEFPVFEVDEAKVFPEVLDVYFRTPIIWPEISGTSTGTNVRRRRLNPKDFLNYRMPLPSRSVQEVIRQVWAEIASLKILHAETTTELDALLPAILDRAFRGEL